jgi:hypothetical protein
MSKTAHATGYIDVRVFIDNDYHCSNSTSPDGVVELAKMQIENKFRCEILGHKLKIEERK